MMKIKDGRNFFLKLICLCFLSISLSSQNLHSMCDAYRADLENYEIPARYPTVSPLISRDFIKNEDGETEDEVIKDIINGKKAAITVCTTPLRSYLISVDHVSLVFELVIRPKEGQEDPSQPLRLFNIHFGGDGDSESIDKKCPIIDNARNTLRKVLRGQRTFITGEEPEDVRPIYTRQMVFVVDQEAAQAALKKAEQESECSYSTFAFWGKDNCCTYVKKVLQSVGIKFDSGRIFTWYANGFFGDGGMIGDLKDLGPLPSTITRYSTYYNPRKDQDQLDKLLENHVILEERKGPKSLEVASSFYNIGAFYGNLGKYEEQLKYLQRALEIRKETPDLLSIARSLYAIGVTYGNLGRYEEKLAYLQRVLEIREKTADPLSIARSLYSVGVVCGDLGKYKEQLSYLERALAIRKMYEEDPLSIARYLYAVGVAYGNLGRYEEQLSYLERALIIREKTYEEDPLSIVMSLYSLGLAYGNLGRYEDQLTYLQKALAIEEKYEADNSSLAITKAAVGEAYKNLRNYGESKRCFEEALGVFEKSDTEPRRKVRVLRLYGELQIEMKEMKKALEILKEALRLQEEKVSKDHPDTALVLRSLGEAEDIWGEKEESNAHLTRALYIQTEKLPAEHPEIAKTKMVIENQRAETQRLEREQAQREEDQRLAEAVKAQRLTEE